MPHTTKQTKQPAPSKKVLMSSPLKRSVSELLDQRVPRFLGALREDGTCVIAWSSSEEDTPNHAKVATPSTVCRAGKKATSAPPAPGSSYKEKLAARHQQLQQVSTEDDD